MKKILIYMIIISAFFAACSVNSSKYTVFECIAGTYGLNVNSANHKQEITRTTEYLDNRAEASKQISLDGNAIILSYTHSEKDIRIPYEVDCFSNKKSSPTNYIKMKYKKGTNELFSIFKCSLPSTNIKILTEEEMISVIEKFICQYIDISLYENKSMAFDEYNQVYTLRYYNEYQGIRLGDELYICSRPNGDVFVFQNYYNNLKNRFTEMGLKINKAECKTAIQNKLDSIYGDKNYEYTCTSTVLYLSSEGIPYIDCGLEVKCEGILTADICNLLVFMNG